MTVTLHLDPDVEKGLQASARARGLSLRDYVQEIVASRAQSLDWSQCPAVESVPGKMSGAWVLKGTRMPVSAIFENLEAGARIEFAARSLDRPPALAH